VSWERRLVDLFEDLEQQAEGAALAARDVEVAELARGEYAEVDLASRIHASLGRQVEASLEGLVLRGRLARAGDGWCLLVHDAGDGRVDEWVVPSAGLLALRGLSPQAQPLGQRPLPARLGLGSVLRSVAEAQEPVLVVRSDGERRQGRVGRVGRDFLELVEEPGGVAVVPFSAVVAIRR
jgi:hypothetical protein